MPAKHTAEELSGYSREELITLNLSLWEQVERLNGNMEKLIEQIRLANADRYGRRTERLDVLEGQLSFFNEAEALSEEEVPEPDAEEVLPPAPRKKKHKGKREEDLKDLPEERITHSVSEEELDVSFGKGCWRRLPDETYKRLRYEPASWTVEVHTVEVYVGTDGIHQDEFLRGDRPGDLLRNSILTPSLAAAILNAKYVNALPLYRIEQEFQRNGVNISRQTMANWVVSCSEKYFDPVYERMRRKLLEYHVNQSDETTVEVIHDGRGPGTTSYMWVHRSGEFYREEPVVLYEYQKTRNHKHPEEFYRDYHGVLVTDGLSQYHLIERNLEGLTSANCWAHARRAYADAVKAAGKSKSASGAIKQSVAYQALARISTIYKLEETLKDLPPQERLKGRQETVRPLVEEYFSWVKERLADTSALPKGKTAEGLRYSVNQEKYLKVFLEDGEVPIDNSASERAIRPFCVGRKNWMIIDSIKGARASAVVYSISETAKLNGLNPYQYFSYLLSELIPLVDEKGRMDTSGLERLMPWSRDLPDKCYKQRR